MIAFASTGLPQALGGRVLIDNPQTVATYIKVVPTEHGDNLYLSCSFHNENSCRILGSEKGYGEKDLKKIRNRLKRDAFFMSVAGLSAGLVTGKVIYEIAKLLKFRTFTRALGVVIYIYYFNYLADTEGFQRLKNIGLSIDARSELEAIFRRTFPTISLLVSLGPLLIKSNFNPVRAMRAVEYLFSVNMQREDAVLLLPEFGAKEVEDKVDELLSEVSKQREEEKNVESELPDEKPKD